MQEIHNIASMCTALIKLLKYNLSSNTLASRGDELESLNNYVDIQKYRYGDIFEYKSIVEPGSEKCVISRFVLQPLVENCLIHGFDDTESGGEVLVKSSIRDGRLRLEVRDNGSGMDAKTLAEVNSNAKTAKPYSKIGVNNIRERIRLQFGGQASLVYESTKGQGTTAILVFPQAAPPAAG
jgi:two-component system sensor histidine kinase YesM